MQVSDTGPSQVDRIKSGVPALYGTGDPARPFLVEDDIMDGIRNRLHIHTRQVHALDWLVEAGRIRIVYGRYQENVRRAAAAVAAADGARSAE